MFYRATNWDEFIAEIAKSKISAPKLFRTFALVFSETGRGKTVEECSEELLSQSAKTTGEHLGRIYKLFDSDYPELKDKKGNVKRQALTEYLLNLYEAQKVSDNISDRLSPSPNPPNIPIPDRIQELTSLEFIGRDRDLTNLANLSRQAKIVLIKAGAGVGKSTLAREFLQTYFKKVIRIEMGLESGNVTPAEEKVSQILRKDFDEEPSRDFGINLDILREKLADRANPIGVLIDNLEPALDENYRFREKLRGYDALLAVLGDRDVSSFTLITSRRSLITPRARVHEYSLEGLDITAWQQYFHDCENGADSEALLQMCVAYNGNAKVMDILHGAIKNRFDGNIGAYWSRYKDALLADSELETLISVEMDWLRDNQPNAYKLLCRMGCYRYQDVKTVPFEGLICLLWDVAESRRAWVVNYLSKSSLIEIKEEYYLHPAIWELARSRLLENNIDWLKSNQQAAKFWTNSVDTIETVDDALKAFESYHHYLEIKMYDKATDIIVYERKNKWVGKSTLGTSCYRLGLLSQIILALNILENKIGSSHQLIIVYDILAVAYRITGRIHDAISICNIALNIATKFKENSSTDKTNFERGEKLVAMCLFNIGICNMYLGNIESAIEWFEMVISSDINIDINCLNADSHLSQIIMSYFCLAYLYSLLDNQEKTHYFIRQSKDFTPVTEWSLGHKSLFLGKAYKNLNDFEEASRLYKQVIVFAEESNYIQSKALALIGLSEIYRAVSNFNDALSHLFESQDLLTKIKAKCYLSEAYFQIGLTYQAMGEHNQAEEYKAKALELFAQMEAPKQIERVNKAFGENIQ